MSSLCHFFLVHEPGEEQQLNATFMILYLQFLKLSKMLQVGCGGIKRDDI